VQRDFKGKSGHLENIQRHQASKPFAEVAASSQPGLGIPANRRSRYGSPS
jgi:hypothetical protein